MSDSSWAPANIVKLIRNCLDLLESRDRLYVALATFIQLSLILLDLLGLILIGGVVTIATSSVQGNEIPSSIQSIIEFFNLEQQTPQMITACLGVIAAIFMILKSLLSYYFGLRNFAFLARREAKISAKMAQEIFSQDIIMLQKFSTSQYQHALTIGCSSVMGGVIGQTLSLATEIALQISMLVTLLFFSPLLTFICLLLFFSLFLVLNRYQGKKAQLWGTGMTKADVATTTSIADAIGSYREILVNGKRSFFIQRIAESRQDAAAFNVNKQMLTQFSKYAFEISVVVAGLGISAYAFLTKSAIEAASLVAIFLTAATRIAPSVLKLQQGLLQLRGAAGATELFFEIHNHISENMDRANVNIETQHMDLDYSSGISMHKVSFTYPNAEKPALHNVSLSIPHQSTFAIVGPSGAGKSTLVDLLLGVISPQNGEIELYGINPRKLNHKYHRIAYVPQNVYLISGSIVENIGLGLRPEEIDLDKCWEVLDRVHLSSWVSSLEHDVWSNVGERGSKISGGQRQRIGIARALYNNPSLIVLDEATSALDAESEYEISKSIEAMRHRVTTIIIAHRLSTVKNCDSVIYLQGGELMGQGTFDELRNMIPNFDRQANLMGIPR